MVFFEQTCSCISSREDHAILNDVHDRWFDVHFILLIEVLLQMAEKEFDGEIAVMMLVKRTKGRWESSARNDAPTLIEFMISAKIYLGKSTGIHLT